MHDRESAAASTIASLVAGVIFVASVGSVLLYAQGEGTQVTEESKDAAVLHNEAGSVLNLLLVSPGQTNVDGVDWVDDPDDLKRLGLANGTDPRALSFEKFQNLRLAPLEANNTDGYVNYDEARSRLGLTDVGLDFHIRAFPTLKSIQALLGTGYRDPNLRVTYIGDIELVQEGGGDPAANLTTSTPMCAAAPDSIAAYRINVTITNDGVSTTQFEGVFDVDIGGQKHQESANTYLVEPGESAELYVDVPDMASRSCASGDIEIDIYDPVNNLDTIEHNFTAGDSITGDVDRSIYIDTSLRHYLADEDDVVLVYDGTSLKNSDKLDLRVYEGEDESGSPVYEELNFSAGNPSSRTRDIGTLSAGNYTAFLEDREEEDVEVKVRERILVVGSAPDAYTPTGGAVPTEYNPHDAVVTEVGLLEMLVERFCPYYFDAETDAEGNYTNAGSPLGSERPDWDERCDDFKSGHTQKGDVFPDLKSVLNYDLPDRLLDGDGDARYDVTTVLVVGSEVDHNSMTSASAKHAVRDWVLGGGTLIVFGSEEQAVQWLQPIFHAGIESSSGGISAPDSSHPSLHVPDELAYQDYKNYDRTWKLNAGYQGHFTNVVVQSDEPVMAVSDSGAFGNGTVIISTWLPYDLVGDGAGEVTEGLKVVNNFLTLSYRDLYLDYGPEIPEGTNVVPAVRKSQIQHPDFDDPITLDLIVYVFGR